MLKKEDLTQQISTKSHEEILFMMKEEVKEQMKIVQFFKYIERDHSSTRYANLCSYEQKLKHHPKYHPNHLFWLIVEGRRHRQNLFEISQVLNVQLGGFAGKRITSENVLNNFGFSKYFRPKPRPEELEQISK